MSKSKIKVGQTWENRVGDIVQVLGMNSSDYYPFRVLNTGSGSTYDVTRHGEYFLDQWSLSDLSILIQDANEPQSKEGEMKDELNEKKYSKQMIEDAHRFLFPGFDDWELTTSLVNAMEEQSEQEHEYQEYLRLKEKFKNL